MRAMLASRVARFPPPLGWARSAPIVLGYVVLYVALDWLSYVHAVEPFAITPWNPPPGLSLALLLLLGIRFAPALLAAVVAAEVLVRGTSTPLPWVALSSLVIAAGYTAAAAILRGPMRLDPGLRRLRDIWWLVVVAAGAALAIAVAYVAGYTVAGLLAWADFRSHVIRFWIGDLIGILTTTPLALLAVERLGHAGRPRWRPTGVAVAQGLAVAAALWVVFEAGAGEEWKYFYVLFLPLVWVAVSHGLPGAALVLFAIQLGVHAATQAFGHATTEVVELQLVMSALAFTGLFLGAAVSERRRAEDQLRERQDQLDRTLRLAGAAEMASAMAHELSQPLSAATSYVRAASLLAERPGERPERLLEAMAGALGELSRAGEVVRRLRDFFRTGTSRLERVAVAELVGATLQHSSRRLERHRIMAQVDVAPGLPDVLVDRVQMETVLHNLVSNAVESLVAASSPVRTIAVRARAAAPGFVEITVHDTGPGVPRDLAGQVLEPFVTTKAEGMGMGLAISRSMVEGHGGRLRVEPVESGATFALTLPVDRAGEDPP
jgi:signal transduction histidine kinase